MIYATFGYPLRWVIATYDVDGLAVDADALPTAAMRFNGAASSQIPTITKRAATTGLYDASCAIDLPLTQGDIIEALVSVIIDGKTYQRVYEWAVVDRPSTNTIAAAVRAWLPEIARLDETISSRLASASYTAPDNDGIGAAKTAAEQVQSRLTAARAGYLDKLNVTGSLSTFDPQSHTVTLGQPFPEHFASLSIDSDGRVTTANPAAVVGSLHTAQDVANLILASPANKLLTNANGEVVASNMRGTDGALTAAAYTAPNNSAIAAIKAKTDNLPASPASTADVQINFDPTITVHPTVLSSESVTAIAAPILAAIDELETSTAAPSVDAIAQRLLVDPANKLLTDASGYVISANVGEGNGQYQISMTITAGGSGVENVLITIPGTSRRYLTDAFGRTNIPADDGTYNLRITPPPGYEPVDDVTVTVAGSDQQVPIELVARPIVIQPPVGTCVLTVRVASQSGSTLAGIPITAKLPKGYTVTADTLNLNTIESQSTDSDGLATLILLRNQPYDLTAKRLDQGAVTLRIQTPDAEQATLSQVIQV